ncbi:MAG: hypothetical protein H7841_05220 [Magnetospirillum sp. WYHS-4]
MAPTNDPTDVLVTGVIDGIAYHRRPLVDIMPDRAAREAWLAQQRRQEAEDAAAPRPEADWEAVEDIRLKEEADLQFEQGSTFLDLLR